MGLNLGIKIRKNILSTLLLKRTARQTAVLEAQQVQQAYTSRNKISSYLSILRHVTYEASKWMTNFDDHVRKF